MGSDSAWVVWSEVLTDYVVTNGPVGIWVWVIRSGLGCLGR